MMKMREAPGPNPHQYGIVNKYFHYQKLLNMFKVNYN